MKILLLFLLLLPTLLMAQTAGLRGTVRDAQQRPVPFASVVLPERRQGTTANAAGEFELKTLLAGPARVSASAVGDATTRAGFPAWTCSRPLSQRTLRRLQRRLPMLSRRF